MGGKGCKGMDDKGDAESAEGGERHLRKEGMLPCEDVVQHTPKREEHPGTPPDNRSGEGPAARGVHAAKRAAVGYPTQTRKRVKSR